MTDRTKSIGASEVAALFGFSPWTSEYSLWMAKCGLTEPRPDTERLRVGRFLEEAVLDEWLSRAGVLGEALAHNTQSIAHPKYPFITATPDLRGRLVDELDLSSFDVVGDVKTVEPTRRRDWDNGTPDYYLYQLQTQMLVTGAKRAVLIALFGFNELSHQWIDADEEVQHEIVKRCSTFWRRVQGDLDPPAPDGHKATTEALASQRPIAKAIELGADAAELTRRLFIVETDLKRFKLLSAELRNKIRASMGDASTGLFVDGSGWRVQVRAESEFTVKKKAHTVMSRIKNKDAVQDEEIDE